MKKVNLLLAAVVAASVSAPALAEYTPNVQMYGYFRSGVASKHTPKDDAWVHRFGRLGYEQDTYAEIGLGSTVAKVDDTEWNVNSRIAYKSTLNRDWQTADHENAEEHANFALREFNLSVKGLLDFDKDANIWVGKRYYRKDLHLTDMFYWDISGMGAGIENLSAGSGKLALAGFRRDDGRQDYVFDTSVSGKLEHTSATASAHLFDVQYSMPLWDGANVAFCDTYIQKQSDDNHKISAANGYGNSNIFALEFTQGFSSGWNKSVIQWTHGSTANWGAFGSPVWLDRSGASDSANRYVFINTGDVKLASNFGINHVLYATYSSGYDTNLGSKDSDKAFQLVVRPYLALTKMTRLYVEAGFSTESTKNKKGDKFETTNGQNQKYTLAYAITPDASNFWSRPEVRFYATYVHSNENGQNLAAYAGDTKDNTIADYDDNGVFKGYKTGDYYKNHNFIFGVQAEAWW